MKTISTDLLDPLAAYGKAHVAYMEAKKEAKRALKLTDETYAALSSARDKYNRAEKVAADAEKERTAALAKLDKYLEENCGEENE